MSSGSSSDSGSSSSSASYDYESAAYSDSLESINDFSVAEGGSGGDQETYNEIMNTAGAERAADAAALTQEQINLQDYETQAYKGIETRAVPTFEQGTGKFTGVKTEGVGTVSGLEYNTANIKGYLLDSTVSDKAKVNMLNQLQGISNSERGIGIPNVDQEAKTYLETNLSGSLENLKNDPSLQDYTSQIDPESSTYLDTLADDPIKTFAKSGLSLTSLVVKSGLDAYRNDQALKTLGYDGKRLSPTYSDSGGILTTEDYLRGQTLGGDTRQNINKYISQAPGLISGESTPTSVFDTFFGQTIGTVGADIMSKYDMAKQNVATTIASPQTSFASYGIFEDARNRGII